ncbi:glycosyl transferase family group 2-domain-containing protein [Boletus edulis BED1]|uniref:Glycosyl transferase family group 2-domain-containing protein n=1 Tax=Boletus edulis BED1 TaxID=1328754 RepID=A0AAD4C983_BOLED|nr:glycosyl transferase family group 2-domain-containing protein [Boletus edulis BED1]
MSSRIFLPGSRAFSFVPLYIVFGHSFSTLATAARDYDPYDALLHHVYQQTQGKAWFRPAGERIATGVCIRTETCQFRAFPYDNALASFEAAVRLLNPVVAVKIRNAAAHAAFATIPRRHDDQARMEIIEKIPVTETEQWDTKPTSKPKSAWRWNWKVTPKAVESQASDLEKDGSVKKEPRLVRLYAPIYCGLAVGWGLVAQYHENSRYYSAIHPKLNRDVDAALPHITIELPVFEKRLCRLTLDKEAHRLFSSIHEDGLQAIGEEQRQERMTFYANPNIGWVARPKHDSSPGGSKRAGRFKKASNTYYGLALSIKLERHLKTLEEAVERGEMEEVEGQSLEDKALELAIEETYEASGRKWRPWASNGKSLRIGEIILIVDADTIVPEDCLRDAARELAECPDVATIQHESDVMQVAFHYFENGIAHFTRRINESISIGCANGEGTTPSYVDGKKRIWSKSNVSEDFDMALRLQLRGYIIRGATYSKGSFKDGVSLILRAQSLAKVLVWMQRTCLQPVGRVVEKRPCCEISSHLCLVLEVPKIWRRFRMALVLSILMAAAIIVLSTTVNAVPVGWQVDAQHWAVVLPLAIIVGCHILFPIVPNPRLAIFSY